MAGRESAAVQAALADIDAGMKRVEAADKHGVALSTLTRARNRRKLPRLPARGTPRRTTQQEHA